MSVSTAFLTLALALPQAAPEDRPVVQPASYHVGSYASLLAARVDSAGNIDGGAGVLSFVDGAGQPMATDHIQLERGPKLTLSWWTTLGDIVASVRVTAMPTVAGGDARLETAVQFTFENPGAEPLTLDFGARLRPGGAPGVPRPAHNLPFEAGTTYAMDGDLLVRDGRVVLRWTGGDPEVSITEQPSGPDAVACAIDWSIKIPANGVRYLTLHMAGPPAQETIREDRFRNLFLTYGYMNIEERALWETGWSGPVKDVEVTEKRQRKALKSALHILRLYGEGYNFIRRPSNRPFGYPPDDTAIQAQLVAPFFEWGMAEFAGAYLNRIVEEVDERVAELPEARKLAHVYALTRCVRLTLMSRNLDLLADAIEAHVVPLPDGLPVEPWLDPAIVRADMAVILERAGRDARLPEFAWAQVEPGSIPEAFQDWRRAISARDSAGSDEALRRITDVLDLNYVGNMNPGADPEASFSLAYLSLMREAMFDDHGTDLIALPGITAAMVPVQGNVETTFLPTRFGLYRTHMWFMGKGKKRLSIMFRGMPAMAPRRELVRVPDGFRAIGTHNVEDGQIEIIEDGRMIKCSRDPTRLSLRALLKIERVEP